MSHEVKYSYKKHIPDHKVVTLLQTFHNLAPISHMSKLRLQKEQCVSQAYTDREI